MPETHLDNDLRSPNNNTLIQVPRTRGSLCLSPVTSPSVIDNKRRSWCGTPTAQLHSKRYGELSHLKMRCDDLLEPYLHRNHNRRSLEMSTPSPSLLPCHQLAPPLPAPSSTSQSRESLLSSNSGSDASSELSEEGYGVICDISLMERIVLSHPIWFLPGIQRAGAFHLLQGKEEGCFVVRKSSQPDTMALSVRLPPDKGPYIEHYLIHSSEGKLGLETSENRFVDMAALVAHYASCCDELPVQLTLPKSIRESKSRQQLSSLALLGQEFWSYSPPVSAVSSPDVELVLNLNPLMSTFKQAEPSTPIPKDKPARPNTLNLFFRNDPRSDLSPTTTLESDCMIRTPPQPPPRWSKPTTPNNFTVTTTVTFSVNGAHSPNNALPSTSQESVEQTRMSPEGQCMSTISSKGSLSRTSLNKMVFPNPISSPHSATPDTLSPLSVSEGARHSKRHKPKISKHYQESDIVDSPTVYYRSGLGDKISDYEDLWTNEKNLSRPVNLSSPDILQHTAILSSNNNVTSPVNSQTGSIQRSMCSSCQNQGENEVQSAFVESSTPVSGPLDMSSPLLPKQGSPFYAEPADSLMPVPPAPRKMVKKSETPLNISLSPLQSFKLVNFRVKPESPADVEVSVNENDSKNDPTEADSDFEWLRIPNYLSSLDPYPTDPEDRTTLQDLILRRFPDLKVSSGLIVDKEACRISAYDNVEDKRSPRAPLSEISEMTEFSDPWAEVSMEVGDVSNPTSFTSSTRVASINKFRISRDPSLSIPLAIRNEQQSEPRIIGGGIRLYALQLAQDKSTTFAQNIDNFIACTRESKESNPQIIMRNIRQFMSGMKNYLVKHGEKGFYKEIERERSKLKPTEFLNLDVILEEVMNKLVVKPLRNHLQKLFLDYYTKTGAIRLLADNIQYASTRQEKILTSQHKTYIPSDGVLGRIAQYLQRLQSAHSPLEKLEYLLAAIAVLFNSVKTEQSTAIGKTNQLGADDFLPLLVWILVKTNFVAAEIESEYMWGLLHPPLLSGEGGYYLTTLSSAVNFLKSFKESCEENFENQVENNSVLKVVVPDELHGSILTKTLPARPHMTTKEVCKIIAHKARITNPQDYALYRLTDGEEMMLLDNECPQDLMREVKHTMLVYKRIDAKIAWPKQDKEDI